MKSLGGLLFLAGAGSIVLYYMNLQFKLLMWIDNWGPTVGWSIRIGFAVVGAILFLIGFMQESDEPAD